MKYYLLFFFFSSAWGMDQQIDKDLIKLPSDVRSIIFFWLPRPVQREVHLLNTQVSEVSKLPTLEANYAKNSILRWLPQVSKCTNYPSKKTILMSNINQGLDVLLLLDNYLEEGERRGLLEVLLKEIPKEKKLSYPKYIVEKILLLLKSYELEKLPPEIKNELAFHEEIFQLDELQIRELEEGKELLEIATDYCLKSLKQTSSYLIRLSSYYWPEGRLGFDIFLTISVNKQRNYMNHIRVRGIWNDQNRCIWFVRHPAQPTDVRTFQNFEDVLNFLIPDSFTMGVKEIH